MSPPNGSLSRASERLIDWGVMTELLGFAWLMRDTDPALAGVVVAAGVQFWLSKNATIAQPAIEEAAAKAAAKVLETAREAGRK